MFNAVSAILQPYNGVEFFKFPGGPHEATLFQSLACQGVVILDTGNNLTSPSDPVMKIVKFFLVSINI